MPENPSAWVNCYRTQIHMKTSDAPLISHYKLHEGSSHCDSESTPANALPWMNAVLSAFKWQSKVMFSTSGSSLHNMLHIHVHFLKMVNDLFCGIQSHEANREWAQKSVPLAVFIATTFWLDNFFHYEGVNTTIVGAYNGLFFWSCYTHPHRKTLPVWHY